MIILGIIVFFVLAYIVGNCLYKRTNDYKNNFVTIRDYEEGVPMNIKVAVFGSTYGKYAFNALADMKVNGFNFCLEAEPLQCDLKLMKKYATHLSQGCLVFITLAACVACCKEEELVALNADNYYKLLSFNELSNNLKYNIGRWLKYIFPINIRNAKKIGRVLIDKPLTKTVVDRHPVSVADEEARQNMMKMTNGWINIFHLQDLRTTEIPDEIQERLIENEKTLNNIIDYCLQEGWRPVVVIPPVSSELNKYFSDAFNERVLTSIVSNCVAEKKIPVFNFLKSKDFQENRSLYCDGGFRLNRYGSKKFIRYLFREMNKYGVIANNSTLS